MTQNSFPRAAASLAETARRLYARGWALGTSGNFSVVLSHDPLEVAITASGASKRALGPADIVRCNARGEARQPKREGRLPSRKASAEALLHLEIARQRRIGAVLHTHSVWSTMLSERHAAEGGLSIEGYEMLKGLSQVQTHEHREWIPILENDQDMTRLARVLGDTLTGHHAAHAILLRRHGLYTWGATLDEAERHVEILEFLFEVIARDERPAGGHHGAAPNPR